MGGFYYLLSVIHQQSAMVGDWITRTGGGAGRSSDAACRFTVNDVHVPARDPTSSVSEV